MPLLIDTDMILSASDQWLQLEQKWGTPIDLDTDDDYTPVMKTVFSTLDLMKSTFDSSLLLKKVRRNVGRSFSKNTVDYKDFLEDLHDAVRNTPEKQFYYISGQIVSAVSVEEICENIDDIFRSIEKLCSATSTVRLDQLKKKSSVYEVVQCSISTSNLSFDDTPVDTSVKEKSDTDDVDRYIDEVFGNFNSTIATLTDDNLDSSSKDSVTTLVKKFSSFLKSPRLVCSPKKKRQCCDKFRELAEFWQSQAFPKGN
ncbi:hypothetical protein MSG28_003191 [Choristoneura fumiferana]|uniref:Uncharacterized protein n=2 Tax=Choristoneura fumiferana TaxID=7141 RepID=A0ACC0KDW3_CHOFU|nr:hypothetical protein MSG28_003191 [Choristoneura fumiferana]